MIRPATARDRAAIARICLLTGAHGADATGVHGDDALLADVYALPYLDGPGGFGLVWDQGDGAVGYVLGTSDTASFQRWFSGEWWPRVAPTHTRVNETGAALAEEAADPRRMLDADLGAYPAHLHVDLLPEAQGRGAGRALIEAACALLAERGVAGVHLGASRANAGALAFYPRVGFAEVGGDEAGVTFARRLGGAQVAE
ncbi:GNAT family N-acetyltransferase [Demequina mangrovi]|uniref:Acetyltransferase (GNAT) family protein n=1 Tax=Demequina mangrovi TaxID=1043493 RepID=A0A1H6WYS0_9MICO|nr:GNAT family N-acetyltransferase [Demequina mangrovi]SEJ21989.1 Acetyltransferase (GNAT) family protein [Demequina mangrovi]